MEVVAFLALVLAPAPPFHSLSDLADLWRSRAMVLVLARMEPQALAVPAGSSVPRFALWSAKASALVLAQKQLALD
jgi:hypothetical protein